MATDQTSGDAASDTRDPLLRLVQERTARFARDAIKRQQDSDKRQHDIDNAPAILRYARKLALPVFMIAYVLIVVGAGAILCLVISEPQTHAQAAGKLIAKGRCGEALSYALVQGDLDLAKKVKGLCGSEVEGPLPSPPTKF